MRSVQTLGQTHVGPGLEKIVLMVSLLMLTITGAASTWHHGAAWGTQTSNSTSIATTVITLTNHDQQHADDVEGHCHHRLLLGVKGRDHQLCHDHRELACSGTAPPPRRHMMTRII